MKGFDFMGMNYYGLCFVASHVVTYLRWKNDEDGPDWIADAKGMIRVAINAAPKHSRQRQARLLAGLIHDEKRKLKRGVGQ